MKNILLCVYVMATLFGIAGCSNGDNLNLGSSSNERSDSAYQIPIVLDGSLQNPAWSPDGKAIVFTRFRNGYNQGPADLAVYNLESGTTRILVSDGSDNINLPGSTWNHATNQIIFSSSREPHDEIFIINAAENPGEEKKITDRVQQVAYEPSFSPDGRWVVFESHEADVENNGIVTKYKIDGTEPYQMFTDVNDDCRQPNWSPHGDRIIYQRFSNGQWDLWLVNTDGSGAHQVTFGTGDKTDASFSPDGDWIVYSSDENELEFAGIFIVPVTGGASVRVTEYTGYAGAPSWSPDGTKIAFEASPGDPDDSTGTSLWLTDVSTQ